MPVKLPKNRGVAEGLMGQLVNIRGSFSTMRGAAYGTGSRFYTIMHSGIFFAESAAAGKPAFTINSFKNYGSGKIPSWLYSR